MPHFFVPRCRVVGLAMLAVIASCSTAFAQSGYPNKTIRIITPFSAGAGPDSVLRVVADKMTRTLVQTVIIDNKPGGNGFIAIEAGKRSANDGYTFVQMDDAQMSLLPHLYKKFRTT